VESSYPIEFDTFSLGWFSASDYLGIALDKSCIIMVAMLVTDSDNISRTLDFSILKRSPGFIRVGDYPDSFV
jgi:hypothetical protein